MIYNFHSLDGATDSRTPLNVVCSQRELLALSTIWGLNYFTFDTLNALKLKNSLLRLLNIPLYLYYCNAMKQQLHYGVFCQHGANSDYFWYWWVVLFTWINQILQGDNILCLVLLNYSKMYNISLWTKYKYEATQAATNNYFYCQLIFLINRLEFGQ